MMLRLKENIRFLRLQRGLSQRDLAKMLHVSQSLISSIENGLRETPLDMVVPLAKTFGVSVDFLYLANPHTQPFPNASEYEKIFVRTLFDFKSHMIPSVLIHLKEMG